MNNREPPKPAVILATPVNVEESRAQRLQRQQARFRDRGGIFVPSSRNTLADILLGKASPLKRPRRSRSVSASPTKGRGNTGNSIAQDLHITALHATSRRSPRKQGRQSTAAVDMDNGKVNPTVISNKPIKNVDAAKGSKQKLQLDGSKHSAKPLKPKSVTKSNSKISAAKVASTSTKKAKKAEQSPAPDMDDDVPVPKSKGKGSKPTISKTSKPAVGEETDGFDEDVPISKPNPKGKAPRKPSKPKTSKATEVKTKSKPTAPAKNSETITSVNVMDASSQPARSRPRKSDLYSEGFSEDEYIPKPATKNAKAKTKGAVSDKAKTISSKPPSVPPKRNKTGITALPDIPEEEEDCAEDRESVDTGQQQENVAAEPKKTAGKGKKRAAQEAGLEQEPPEPPKKRVKKIDQEAKSADPENSKRKAQKKSSTKRPRSEDAVDEPDKKAVKRKKGAEDTENDADPGSKAQKASKPRSQRSATTKPTSRQATKTAKRKENASAAARSKPQAKAPVRKGPPKSVLQRIKDSQPDDVDNEPDPIDFLS